MHEIIHWNFIPMFVRRLLYKYYSKHTEGLDILSRVLIEIKMFEAYSFKRYSVRAACHIEVRVFTNNLKELLKCTQQVQEITMAQEYVTDEWKEHRFRYGKLSLDEYFSVNGFDTPPEPLIRVMMLLLKEICTQIKLTEKTRRHYYLRHFKPLLEDGIEVLHQLRTIL